MLGFNPLFTLSMVFSVVFTKVLKHLLLKVVFWAPYQVATSHSPSGGARNLLGGGGGTEGYFYQSCASIDCQ